MRILHSFFMTTVSFQGVGGSVPRYHMDSLAEILMALNANCVTLLSTWLQVCGGVMAGSLIVNF
jgi:hypothetical protein